jgi:hypothetical protein
MSELPPRSGEYAVARQIAQRLALAGENPYSDDREQYLVLESGEIIDFGRPLRDHRMFPVKSRAKTERLAEDLAAFGAAHGWHDWHFWSVCRPSRKTRVEDLEADYREFNSLLNAVFTDLRQRFGFECLVCGIHVRYDPTTGLFDLHAHFVCRVPAAHVEAVHRRLLTEFSRAHLPKEAVRSPQAVARYIARTFDLSEVAEWPEDAIVAAFRMGGKRFHYTRTAGAFAGWRAAHRTPEDPHHLALLRNRRQNRAETRYTGTGWDHQDRHLVTRDWRFGDKVIRGSLYRRAPRRWPPGGPPPSYPPAVAATTQTPPSSPPEPTPAAPPPPPATPGVLPPPHEARRALLTPQHQPPKERTRYWCSSVLSAVRRICIRFTATVSRFFHRRE